MQAARVLLLVLALNAGQFHAQPNPSNQGGSSLAAVGSQPSKTAGNVGVKPSATSGDKPRGRKPKGRRGTGGRRGAKRGGPRRKPDPLPEPGTLPYMWHVFIWAYTYPFYYLNDHYGPFAANAFGAALIVGIFVLPAAFRPKRDRELKLKERLVRAKNTRNRVKAAQTIEQYMTAVDLLTKDVDELGFPLRGLRKMYRMPPASPVTYSKAVKELKKEVINVNERIYPVGQRSLDQALQDLRGCLARELEVSTEEAGEMASTVIHRSNQPRTIGDPSLALRAMVADNPLVEIRLFDQVRKPLMINCRDGKVEVRREAIYVVVPAGGAEPLVYFQLFFSINFRSTTDEGTMKIMRWAPGSRKRPRKSKHELGEPEESSWALWRTLQSTRNQADLWIERKLTRLTAIVTWPWKMMGLASPPPHGVDAERVRVFASAVQEASSPSEMMRIVNEFLKSTNAVQIRNLCEALGIDEQADLTEEEANLQLKEHSIAIDGVVVADVGAGIVQRVRAKLQRRIGESMSFENPEAAEMLIERTIHAAARQCTGEEAYQVMAALFRHRRIDVDIVRDRAYSQPIEITTEGGEVVTEYRSLFSLVDYSAAEPSVLQWVGVRHKTIPSPESESLGLLQFQEMVPPGPAAKPPKTQKSSSGHKDHNTRVLAKVRARLKELEKIKRGSKSLDPNSASSSPTSSQYPSTVGSRPSSAGSSPQFIEELVPVEGVANNTTAKHPAPLNLEKPTIDPTLKPRSAALARAFLKRAGHTPPATPEATPTPTSSHSNGTPPTEAKGKNASPTGAINGEGADGAGVAAPAEGVGQVVTNTTSSAEDAGQEVAQEAPVLDTSKPKASREGKNGKGPGPPGQDKQPTPPRTPPRGSRGAHRERRKSLDPLDDQFEAYMEKLVQKSPQLLGGEESSSDDHEQPEKGESRVVDQARAYLAGRKVVEAAKEVKPDWLQAVEQASRSAEQARLAANAALDRIKTGNSPVASPLASPVITSITSSPVSTP